MTGGNGHVTVRIGTALSKSAGHGAQIVRRFLIDAVGGFSRLLVVAGDAWRCNDVGTGCTRVFPSERAFAVGGSARSANSGRRRVAAATSGAGNKSACAAVAMAWDHNASNSASVAGSIRNAFRTSILGENFVRFCLLRKAPYIPVLDRERHFFRLGVPCPGRVLFTRSVF